MGEGGSAAAGAGPAAAFRAGVSGEKHSAAGVAPAVDHRRLRSTAGIAAGAHRCGHQLAGLRAFLAGAGGARSDRTGLPRPLFPAGRGDFSAQLPADAQRHTAATIEMGDRGNAGGHRSVRRFLHRTVRAGCDSAAVDELIVAVAGAGAAVLRVRHHPVPADGCGHHLQARAGLHGRDGRCAGGVCGHSGVDWSAFPYGLAQRACGRGAGDCGGGIPVSAVPRLDAGAAGPLFLSGPAGLSADADRVWTHADERSAAGADAGFGDGPAVADAAG